MGGEPLLHESEDEDVDQVDAVAEFRHGCDGGVEPSGRVADMA